MNLTTEYLGFQLSSPFMPGASPLVDDLDNVRRLEDAGASAIVMHSFFEEQITLEQRAREAHIEAHEGGSAEALSFFPDVDDLDQTGEEYRKHSARTKAAVKVPVIAGGWVAYARQIEQAGADALELNYYDLPANPDETGAAVERRALDMVAAVRKEVKIPLAVKLSPFFSSLPNFAKQLVEAGANGLVLFNRFYQPDIDIDALDVLPVLELSSPSELRLRLRWLAILSARIETGYSATGGIHSAPDAIRSIMAGAHTVQLVSALLRFGPEHLKVVIKQFVRWMEQHEYESVQQMRGAMNLKHCPDVTGFERANYLKILHGWQV